MSKCDVLSVANAKSLFGNRNINQQIYALNINAFVREFLTFRVFVIQKPETEKNEKSKKETNK
jgi:hypothetical protein